MKRIAFMCVILCSVFVMQNADAQEYTRDIQFVSSGGNAFVCRHNTQKWIFCSTDTARQARFIQLDTSSVSAPYLSIAGLHLLYDAKTLDALSYFCGDIELTSKVTLPVFGYFNRNGFPNVTVNYVCCSTVNNIYRLEPFFDGHNNHVVLIGVDTDNKYCLVDALYDPDNGPNWVTYKGTDSDEDIVYDDIAVTSDHVIVSARKLGTNIGYIYVFGKPYLTGIVFSAQTPKRYQLASDVYSPILLSKAEGDRYVAVYSASSDGLEVVVKEFEGCSYLAGAKFYYPQRLPSNPSLAIKEVNFDGQSGSVDILVWENVYGAFGSTIWSVTHSQLLSASDLQGHRFAGDYITSVSRATVSSATVLAAGYTNNSYMRTFRFVHNVWSGCSTHPVQKMVPITMDPNDNPPEFTFSIISRQQGTVPKTTGNIGITTICGPQN